mmetsp:Transcript_33759/g.54705  ORF Transcript_33759/g.54705 Transcript_33759/m.54705 type:complete len:386 (-) Transcript_33759:112-1269(-)|eukprot:CAMPEP_0184655492 /NCGR_PEP_ID=MMETSP0308-20130426/13094_1 /TAXON_ID=38269 /ORGANISM="Gloeochaete witrockiana, Strain SAG 46.84" /LENGTH=385 /DNA_ID=CAMNT_0027091981 /DNA_START=1011 /DNA_END=2168 /DNA_ORIENTATION=+
MLGGRKEVLNRLKRFDAYPKTHEDYRQKTVLGGVVSVFSSIIISYLFFSELAYFLSVERTHELYVDTSRGEKLQINLNVTFPGMQCSVLSLDAMDISGEHQLDVYLNIFKRRIDKDGIPIDDAAEEEIEQPLNAVVPQVDANYCGSCYGSGDRNDSCCNTCEEVREQYRKKGWAFANVENIEQCIREGFVRKLKAQAGEGCNVYGFLEVNKVAGNFHFAPGKSFQQAHMHVHDLMPFQSREFNVSHHIYRLSFGQDFPGVINPLDHQDRIVETGSGMFQYFVKVVPTLYQRSNGQTISTNQFAYTEHFRAIDVHGAARTLPGVFFFYDLSPIMVKFTEKRRSFAHFMTNVCAIVGGVFTVAGIIDSFLYHGSKAIQKKMQMGKLS